MKCTEFQTNAKVGMSGPLVRTRRRKNHPSGHAGRVFLPESLESNPIFLSIGQFLTELFSLNATHATHPRNRPHARDRSEKIKKI
jgi:hypothetical protein